MPDFEACLLALLALAVAAGACSIWWVRAGRHAGRQRWGRRLFIACLFVLGTGNLVALNCAARCLVPFGLSAGWLVIAMLWENPFRACPAP